MDWVLEYELLDETHMPIEVGDEVIYPFPIFNGRSAEVYEWISNFIPHFILDVIIYPRWDLS